MTYMYNDYITPISAISDVIIHVHVCTFTLGLNHMYMYLDRDILMHCWNRCVNLHTFFLFHSWVCCCHTQPEVVYIRLIGFFSAFSWKRAVGGGWWAPCERGGRHGIFLSVKNQPFLTVLRRIRLFYSKCTQLTSSYIQCTCCFQPTYVSFPSNTRWNAYTDLATCEPRPTHIHHAPCTWLLHMVTTLYFFSVSSKDRIYFMTRLYDETVYKNQSTVYDGCIQECDSLQEPVYCMDVQECVCPLTQ